MSEWSRRVADCRSSGMSVSRWCAEQGINTKTYYAWQKKVFAEMVERQGLQAEKPQARFAELPAPTEPTPPREPVASLRIGKATLEVYEGASPEVIATLCQVLNHAP